MNRRRPPASTRPKRRGSGRTVRPDFPSIGARALRRFHAERDAYPMCGAKARSTGEPCRQTPAKGRTRCRFHGGATPRGDGPAGWHTPGFPNGLPTGKPRSDAHKARKRRQRRAEIAAMTADELARLEAWRHTHKPGSRRDRAYGRHAREARQWLDTIMQETPSAPTPGQAELDALRARFRAHLAQLEAEIAEAVEDEPPVGGLFD
ncbi:HGGxSTG domain-containing protein [Methylobacterium sp.]|uniref:HGGxSTG domain-containing protein n=1 Tax=Methylobacterium sp. TaxID=409 RepID=UPI000A7F6B48|nr:HGGxSTG domain-containing protein [Methylobacterium sp.]RUP17123.1 MAG: hypothetical protein EKK44_30665 [Methylobacterium sp.]